MTTMWAIVWPDGGVLADSNFRDEAHAWTIALGWPSDEEIADAKARGYKALQLQVDTDAPAPELSTVIRDSRTAVDGYTAEITGIHFLAGELTLKMIDHVEVPQDVETGMLVSLKARPK